MKFLPESLNPYQKEKLYDNCDVKRTSFISRFSKRGYDNDKGKMWGVEPRKNSISQWEDLIQSIKNSKRDSLKYNSSFGRNVLHIVCKYNPPLGVIELILKKMPWSVSEMDINGRYPLHLASKYGALPEVLDLLSFEYPNALSNQDCHGKTPLHLVCESYPKYYQVPISIDGQRDYCPMSGTPLVRNKEHDFENSIVIMTRKCPQVVNLEDNKGCSALEYALGSDFANLEIINYIQKVSYWNWVRLNEREGDHVNRGNEKFKQKENLNKRGNDPTKKRVVMNRVSIP